jgi:hypothetical protein
MSKKSVNAPGKMVIVYFSNGSFLKSKKFLIEIIVFVLKATAVESLFVSCIFELSKPTSGVTVSKVKRSLKFSVPF